MLVIVVFQDKFAKNRTHLLPFNKQNTICFSCLFFIWVSVFYSNYIQLYEHKLTESHVDSEVGGLNLGDGKSLFFWTTTENEMEKRSVWRRQNHII